jgi:uncharacterized membrane protein YozB (DUF420 family)
VIEGTVKGFLGTPASFGADLNLTVQLVMGLALIGGAFLARAKRYAAHGVCMTTVLVLNLVPIAVVMLPSFAQLVVPQLAGHLHKQYYFVATVHGAFGTAAELLGLYILLVAGTNILPEAWRFKRWKLWMRVELALWMAVLLSGIGTYIVWYTPLWRRWNF